MLSPSDFNNAVPQFTNGDYASSPINPQYIAEPDAVNYNRGAEPLQTLPAQWWNWFLNKFTGRFNKVNIYVNNIFNELAQLLTLVSVTPSGTEGSPTIGQLKDMFENKYPNYLALLMYPVGSIYWTGKAPNDGGDPNVLFGGTWVQIKDRFILAAGTTYTNGATGGAATVTLTTAQLPIHHHSFTASGSVSVTTNPTFTGSEFSLTYTPAGSISITTNPTFWGTAGTVNVSGGSHSHTYYTGGSGGSGANAAMRSSKKESGTDWDKTTASSGNLSMSGTFTPSGSISGGAYKFTGTQATIRATAGGTISGGAYKFTGTAGTTGSKGDGDAHENMPPYIVKYCWERTA